MEEINRIRNYLMYPIYWIEKVSIILYIYWVVITNKNVSLSSIQCQPYFPFWMRQYDDCEPEYYCDEFVKGIIQVSVHGNVWKASNVIHSFETKHYNVDVFFTGNF